MQFIFMFCKKKKGSGVFNLGSRTCADFLKLSKILKKITKSKKANYIS